MKGLTVIVPTLNEEANVQPIVERISQCLTQSSINYEIIFIDDHSSDHTREAINSLASQYPVQGFLKKGPRGKAQSIIEGCEYARYEIIAFIDADLQYPPEIMPSMYDQITSEQSDIVVTRRRVRYSNIVRKTMSNGFRIIFSKWLHGMDYDVQSGLKMFRKEVIYAFDLNPSPWSFDLEFMVKARKSGYRISSVDIQFGERTAGETKVGFIKASYEVGMAAIKLKLSMISPVSLNSKAFRKAG